MDNSEKLLGKIETNYSKLSKGQKKIADFIKTSYDKAAYITASKLGTIVGVSESTVVRFACQLGYAGYPEMQADLQKITRNQLTAAQRVDITSERIADDDALRWVLESDISNIRKTLEDIDSEVFGRAVDAICGARKIFIIGVRSSASLASFLSFYLNLVSGEVVNIVTSTSSELFEQLFRIGKDDVLIAISFPRYSKRTLKAINYAKSRFATVVGITDALTSPIAESSDMALTARSDMASFVDSLAAPLSVINALLVAIGIKKKKEVVSTFENLEQIWDEYEVYEKFDAKG